MRQRRRHKCMSAVTDKTGKRPRKWQTLGSMTGAPLWQCAGGMGCGFVAAVLLTASFLASINAIPFDSALPAGHNVTCYSAATSSSSIAPPVRVQSYKFNGTLRQAPLPRHTRWRVEEGSDWEWPSVVYRELASPASLWYVRGIPYDLSTFAARHPGGHRFILNTANTDITELFEAHHIGTTAAQTLRQFRHGPPATASLYGGHESRSFRQLKYDLAKRFDIDVLKTPTAEHTALFWATLLSHIGLFGACLSVPAASRLSASWQLWLLHSGLGVTTAWLGGFAHNGLHLWPRRRIEALSMYLSLSNNPFRWMQKHVVSHHVHCNTAHDGDKPVVGDFQRWWHSVPLLNFFGLTLGTFLIGLHSSCCRKAESLTMTLLEQTAPLALLGLALTIGCRRQGWRFAPRLLWTMSLTSTYTFILFQVSHYQPSTLDGDAVHATVDDWGDFQLRTTWGWQQLGRPLLCLPFLYLNLQPAHHLLPAVHHSRLREITPLMREHYPGLMDDHSISQMMVSMGRILQGHDCLQQPLSGR